MTRIVYYVSGHGFGHAARSGQLIERLVSLRGDLEIRLRTSAPPQLFPDLGAALRWEWCCLDTGVRERTPLQIDVPATREALRNFRAGSASLLAAETRYMRDQAVRLIVADVSYLAPAVARAAGIPAILVGNFTWDWIYEPFLQAVDDQSLRHWLADGYRQADVLLRLPFHHPVRHVRRVVDVPLLGRRSRRTREEIRDQLGLRDESRPVILAGMRGGLPEAILERVARENGDLLFLCLQDTVPRCRDNLRPVTIDSQMTFPDLLSVSDAIVSKLGYGVVSEAIANRTRILWPARQGFREDEIIAAELPQHVPAEEIPVADFLTGAWRAHLHGLLQQPMPATVPDTSGNEACAQFILDALA